MYAKKVLQIVIITRVEKGKVVSRTEEEIHVILEKIQA